MFYLKQNVVLEALVDRWYGWSHLISPATAALNIRDRHLKIMKSFIQNPKIHVAAVKKPEMRGGPFIDYGVERLDEIRGLYEETLVNRAELLELAEAIHELGAMLNREAKGGSMIPLYAAVPETLRGFVELVYDVEEQPGFRLFESLLYHSKYYQESAQSISLQLVNSDTERSFVLSTPRLDDPAVIHSPIPFKEAIIDQLFRMHRIPGSEQDIALIAEKLGVSGDQQELFQSFFTEEPPKPYVPYTGPGIRTRYFGHACVLVETSELSILVDPVISYDGYEKEVHGYTVADLPEVIDYVLITHNHQDHVLLETLLQLRHKIDTIVVPSSGKGALQDPSLKFMFRQIGFSKVIELDDMERIDLPKCVITALPFLGEHADLDVRSKACFHVQMHNRFNVMFVADSKNIEPKIYEKVQACVGTIDVLFLGMECDGAPLSWLYGPLLREPLSREKDQVRRLSGSDCSEGMDLVRLFKPSHVFVYAMGLEPWLEFISSIKYTDASRPIIESDNLIRNCMAEGIVSERLFGEKTIEF